MGTSIYIEAGQFAEQFANWLENKGYRYGYSGTPCERRAAHNMPYIHVDIEKGFYRGFKGREVGVNWIDPSKKTKRQMNKLIPDISEIHDRARKGGNKIRDNHMRVESKDGRKMERVWYTGNGKAIGISRMDDDHLHNTILMVDRNIANGMDTTGLNHDLAGLLNELEDERIHRGLHLPLVPLKSLEYRKGNI